MAGLSQSHFLQSLGWATLNSFWQLALLWCVYIVASYLFKLSSHKKYQLAVGSIIAGFCWFIITFCIFLQNNAVSSVSFFNETINQSNSYLNIFLLSASISYLALLLIPAYRLFNNWRFVQRIKKEGLEKANYNLRLFVQKIAANLGIKKNVRVYLSNLVKSPVTVGYFKPLILIPIAAINNLNTQQIEAVLLHELSHIRRYDYLMNFIVSIIHTLLYFNPFIKQFIKVIEEERENCCDELVIYYGYDKVGYATALLTLEKISKMQHSLAIGVTGRKNLLNRIEKIVGMEKKNGFKLNHFTGLIAALFFILLFNSVMIIKEEKKGIRNLSLAYTDVTNPFHYFESEDATQGQNDARSNNKTFKLVATVKPSLDNKASVIKPVGNNGNEETATETDENTNTDLANVNYDIIDGSLTPEQKEVVKTTVAATKKIVTTFQWKEVEKTIADAMTEQEKKSARQEYIKELDKTMNWKNVEENLKSKYDNVDWTKIKNNVSNALTLIQLDSLEQNYNIILSQLDKEKASACDSGKAVVSPLPDQSIEQINKAVKEVRKNIQLVRALKNKKIIRL